MPPGYKTQWLVTATQSNTPKRTERVEEDKQETWSLNCHGHHSPEMTYEDAFQGYFNN